MERINYNSFRLIEFIDNINPKNFGIFFSIFFHLMILLFAVGMPNFFGPKDIYVPNIIPVEILNVSDTTNVSKSETNNQIEKNIKTKQKKFNSSEITEVQKEYEVVQNIKKIEDENQPNIEIKEKASLEIEKKNNIEIKKKEISQKKILVETIKTDSIKPKLKPKPKVNKPDPVLNKNDLQIEPKNIEEKKPNEKEFDARPKPKPKEDFSIASMLKDLRNEKSNITENEEVNKEQKQNGKDETSQNNILSISEIDLLRQQLSSCWNAPAGAVINIGDKVTISAKVQQNMKVFENSVRIVDTNISKSNPFYGPITDSAMRTLLNPECTPLKLPEDKYNLWKNLTITFDYSIMKGY